MTDEEGAANRHGATDEHLDAAQDEVSGEAAPDPRSATSLRPIPAAMFAARVTAP